MSEHDHERVSGPEGKDAIGTPVRPDPGGPKPQPEHPEVGHEHSDVNARGILWTAGIMVAVAAVLHVVVWGLFVYFQDREHGRYPNVNRQLAETNQQPVAELVPEIPAPRIEGIDARATQLILRTEEGETLLLDVPVDVLVEQQGKDVSAFDLPEGAEVAVVYELRGGRNRVISVFSPPHGHEGEFKYHRDKQTARGKVVHVEPKDIALRRAWSEAQLSHYGWADQKAGLARIPIQDAMSALLSGKLRGEYLKVQDGVKGGPDAGRGHTGGKQ